MSEGAFSKAWAVYQSDEMSCLGGVKGLLSRPTGTTTVLIVSMSRTGISLSGVLASKNRLRFTRRNDLSTRSLNDVLADNSLNDVLAVKT